MNTVYENLIDESDDLYQNEIIKHPLLDIVFNQQVSKAQYASYLRETCHVVKHTPRFLSLTAARFSQEQRSLREYFLTQARDEDGHDKFCLNDLEALGLEPKNYMLQAPKRGAWFLVTQSYFNATVGNPIANLGLASLTEGLGAQIAGAICSELTARHFMTKQSTTFLRGHSAFDVGHLAEVKNVINAHVKTEEDLEALIAGRKMAIIAYAQLFSDVAQTATNTAVFGNCLTAA